MPLSLQAHRDGPSSLSPKQCHALAHIVYRAFADGLEDDPINEDCGNVCLADNQLALNGPLPGLMIAPTPTEQARIERHSILNRRFGPFVDAVLLREGVICDDESRQRSTGGVRSSPHDAAKKLKRNAEGDYSPDPAAARFPNWEGNRRSSKKRLTTTEESDATITALFNRWRQHPDQKSVSPSTEASYTAVFTKFRAFIVKRFGSEPSAALLTRDDFEHSSTCTLMKTVFRPRPSTALT